MTNAVKAPFATFPLIIPPTSADSLLVNSRCKMYSCICGFSSAKNGGRPAFCLFIATKYGGKAALPLFLLSERRKSCICIFTADTYGGKAALPLSLPSERRKTRICIFTADHYGGKSAFAAFPPLTAQEGSRLRAELLFLNSLSWAYFSGYREPVHATCTMCLRVY
ncbi:hypothetical protein AAC387_Pa02g4875 [Persea americana]